MYNKKRQKGSKRKRLMKMIKKVGDKLDTKLKSGELKESELMEEAMELMQQMESHFFFAVIVFWHIFWRMEKLSEMKPLLQKSNFRYAFKINWFFLKQHSIKPGICHMDQNILTPVVIILARVDLDRFDANCRQDFYRHIFLK